MVDCLIRQIHIQLEENESWSDADYVSPELKVPWTLRRPCLSAALRGTARAYAALTMMNRFCAWGLAVLIARSQNL